MECWYEFFLEKGGARIEFSLFANIFIILTRDGETPVSGSDGALRWVSLQSAVVKFHEHYHKQFNL